MATLKELTPLEKQIAAVAKGELGYPPPTEGNRLIGVTFGPEVREYFERVRKADPTIDFSRMARGLAMYGLNAMQNEAVQ